MSLRPRNTATAQQVAAVLKGCLSCLAPEKYLQVDLDLVASLAFEVSLEEATAFGRRLTGAFAYCQQKKKSYTSGKELSPAVYRAVRA